MNILLDYLDYLEHSAFFTAFAVIVLEALFFGALSMMYLDRSRLIRLFSNMAFATFMIAGLIELLKLLDFFYVLFFIFLAFCFCIAFFLMLSSDPNRRRIGRKAAFVILASVVGILLFLIVYAAVSGSV